MAEGDGTNQSSTTGGGASSQTGGTQASGASASSATTTSQSGQGSQNQQTQQTSQTTAAAPRPQWLPENFHDAKTGPKWDDFGKHYSELATFKAADDVRRNALPANADAYKVGTTGNFKPPEGVKFEINDGDPLWAQAKSWAHKHGLSQEAFAEAIDLVAGRDVGTVQAIKAARDAEIAKLGAAGPALITSINTWLDANGVSGLKARMLTAQDAQDFAKLIGKFTNQGAPSFQQNGRDPAGGNEKMTDERWKAMSPAARLDWNRQHDQKQMPEWRDPRAAA